jgi:glycosyltransferase involved in cell wall biosynthesis
MNTEKKIPCTVEVLTRNSEVTLERCLESVKNFGEILVLDGNSTDGTLDIARKYGAKIVKQYETEESVVRITDFSDVRNKGLRLAVFPWFLFIDSDEYLSPEAGEEIRVIVTSFEPKAYAWWLGRKYLHEGKIVDCATTYPNRQMRFFHRDHVVEFQKPIHEKIRVMEGTPIGILEHVQYVPLIDHILLEQKWESQINEELKLFIDAPRMRIFRAILRNTALLFFYTYRYIRNFLFCRGYRLPLRYEVARHKRTFLAIGKLCRMFLRNDGK